MEMTLEELIIGHYEEVLSTEQEYELTTIISNNTDAKSMYEEYGKVETLMMEDAGSTDTDEKLDKAVLAAALSAGALTVISGGSQTASWITGKMGMIGGTILTGAVGTALYFGFFSDKPKNIEKHIADPVPKVKVNEVPLIKTPTIDNPIIDKPIKKATNELTNIKSKSSLNKVISKSKVREYNYKEPTHKLKKKSGYSIPNPNTTIKKSF